MTDPYAAGAQQPPQQPPSWQQAPPPSQPQGYLSPGQQPLPGNYPQQPPPRRRGLATGAKVGIGVGVAFAVLGGCGIVGMLAFAGKKASDATDARAKTTLSTPATIGNATLSTDGQGKQAADGLRAVINKNGAETAVAGFYADTNSGNPAFLVASAKYDTTDTGPLLDNVIKGTEQAASNGITFSTVDAGKLGGRMRCGDTNLRGQNVTICAWNDPAVIGLAYIYNSSGDAGVSKAQTIREAMTKRS
jgi:hypothetical protein